MTQPRALDGIRVVDFSWVRAGPWATRWLGAMGAEIIKIEWPENERGRLPSSTTPQGMEVNLNTSGNFNDTNVNKKSLSLNVRSAKGLEIVRTCRNRYDGKVRNPFNEYECGHWYARAMSSYALLQAFSGARYDAVDKVLHLAPRIRGDFRCFLSTATGYGTVGVQNGKPFFDARAGKVEVKEIKFQAMA